VDLLLRAWARLTAKLPRAERGQGSIEYVLLILGCVLFLIAAAILLKDMLGSAVTAISSWANTVGPP
jgi:uncharacterized protein (UPF0333 family)